MAWLRAARSGRSSCAFGNTVIVVIGAGGDFGAAIFDAAPRTRHGGGGSHRLDVVWLAPTHGDVSVAAAPSARDEDPGLYTPLALSLALTLSFAASWRRKLGMLCIGLGLLLLRLAIAIALPVGRAFSSATPTAPGAISELVWYVLIDLPAMSYVAPLFAWWLASLFTATRD